MSSTGTVHKTRAAISNHGEEGRKVQSDIGASPGVESSSRRAVGTVKKVHKDKPRLIKAYADDFTPLANGRWIELNHSAQEIAERWGTVRVGFRVRVNYTGPSGEGADAVIVGVENEGVEDSHVPNDAATGLWAIFHGHFI